MTRTDEMNFGIACLVERLASVFSSVSISIFKWDMGIERCVRLRCNTTGDDDDAVYHNM